MTFEQTRVQLVSKQRVTWNNNVSDRVSVDCRLVCTLCPQKMSLLMPSSLISAHDRISQINCQLKWCTFKRHVEFWMPLHSKRSQSHNCLLCFCETIQFEITNAHATFTRMWHMSWHLLAHVISCHCYRDTCRPSMQFAMLMMFNSAS